MDRISEVAPELRRCWLEVLCDHLYHLADELEGAAPLDEKTVLSAWNEARDWPQAWIDAYNTAFQMSRIWEIDEDELFYLSAERLSHLDWLEDDAVQGLVDAISELCLDLAQHIDFTLTMLGGEDRASASLRAITMARELADMPLGDRRDQERITPGIIAFGADGLESWSRA